MSSAASSSQQPASNGNLPLILCPRCGRALVSTEVTQKEGPNQGKRFYKCPLEDAKPPCKWFKWEEQYVFFASAAQENAVQAAQALPNQIQAASNPMASSWIVPMMVMNTLVNVIICVAIMSLM